MAHIYIYVRLTENKPGICLAAMKYADDRWIRNNMSHGVEYAIIWDETEKIAAAERGREPTHLRSEVQSSNH